ncbi:MAG: hypothetical protein ABI999_17245 [Acidobacteriota bacterium]
MDRSKERLHLFHALVERITAIIDIEKRSITNRELLDICSTFGVETLSNEPHLCHEIAEASFNLLLSRKYARELLDSNDPTRACSEILRHLEKRLPTQTWRSSRQAEYQQFSTPAPIAYLAAYLLNLKSTDTVLEPSCGTGSLAVWAHACGAIVVTNEIDTRRCDLARLLGFDPTEHDAQFIDDLMPESVIPNVILSNPPFSSTGGRVARNQYKFGFRHVESALRRLGEGGRFAVILGENGSASSRAGKRLWESLLPDIRVSVFIELPGREYYRNGTTICVTLILGRKIREQVDDSNPAEVSTTIITASSVEDAFEKTLRADLLF